jgi:hypothetical protein
MAKVWIPMVAYLLSCAFIISFRRNHAARRFVWTFDNFELKTVAAAKCRNVEVYSILQSVRWISALVRDVCCSVLNWSPFLQLGRFLQDDLGGFTGTLVSPPLLNCNT